MSAPKRAALIIAAAPFLKLLATLLDLLCINLLLALAVWLAYRGRIDSALLAVIAHSLWCIEVRLKIRGED